MDNIVTATPATPATPSAAQLARAAELRAAGNAWEFVAADLGLSAADVRRWPTVFAPSWRKAYHLARKVHLNDALGEAVFTLRM